MIKCLTYHKIIIFLFCLVLVILTGFYYIGANITDGLLAIYQSRQSITVKDRNSEVLLIRQNQDGYYSKYIHKIPTDFEKLLLAKEDKYFYFHPGLNPISSARALYNFLLGGNKLTSSTITQQLAKILLRQENNRSFKNKIKETIYSLALEMQVSKKNILKMYINTVYFGNTVQGIAEASRLYFDISPENLSNEQILKLLVAISNPSNSSPFDAGNIKAAENLSRRLGLATDAKLFLQDFDAKILKEKFNNYLRDQNYFELENLNPACSSDCRTSIDSKLSGKLREILKRNLNNLVNKNTGNGAIVVMSFPLNELVAMIGSPDPTVDAYGYKINMAIKPRAIGSTIKPFIYLKGFEKNLRPYSLVDDKEYKYLIGDGFAFYPKNYDYQYHGRINLHYALSNSLNVPTVKVLEYYGIENFSNFLLADLKFKPVQDIRNYELGIALGGMEMDLLTLSQYFSLFANHGQLRPLQLFSDGSGTFQAADNFYLDKKIASENYIELINSILSDRITGAEQFGLASNLNLPHSNYALKTGTSKDYRDSWTIGYTPDFLVGVWVGNSDNSSMDNVSGVAGAGKIWQEAMNLLYNSSYNKNTPFKFDSLTKYADGNSLEYGLAGDDFAKNKNLLIQDGLILKPHDGDEYLLEKDMKINLTASEPVEWFVNDQSIGSGSEKIFVPQKIGTYTIKAKGKDSEEEIKIYFVEEEN